MKKGRYEETTITKEDIEKNGKIWLLKNGFNEDGITYIYIGNNSYEIRGELKQLGYKFNSTLMWHSPILLNEHKDLVMEVSIPSVAEHYAWGYAYLPDAAERIKKEIASRQPVVKSESTWFGQEKERFYDLPVTFVSSQCIGTRFGQTNLYIFKTAEGCVLEWWTQSNVNAEVGSMVLLTATVKDHTEYNGEKRTRINRAKIKEA